MLSALVLAAVVLQAAPADAALFDYDRSRPLDVQETSRRSETGVVLRDISYAMLDGSRNAATVVGPERAAAAPSPAILFVHWYGPPAPTSNRTQFVPDAVALARQGVTSLLIDTP